jgi:hypothetical protein
MSWAEYLGRHMPGLAATDGSFAYQGWGDFPYNNFGVNVFLPQGARHRYSVVAVAYKGALANPDQLNQRQRHPTLLCLGDAQPALHAVAPERIETAVEIAAAPLAPANLCDRYGLHPGRAARANTASGLHVG